MWFMLRQALGESSQTVHLCGVNLIHTSQTPQLTMWFRRFTSAPQNSRVRAMVSPRMVDLHGLVGGGPDQSRS